MVDLRLDSSAESLRLAVLADLHVDSNSDIVNLQGIAKAVVEAAPDFIVLLGDYSSSAYADQFRDSVLKELSIFDGSKTVAVLGNHEHASDALKWTASFGEMAVTLLRNQAILLSNKGRTVCFRGLDDYFSEKTKPTPFPPECSELAKISLTHDPAAAYFSADSGVFLAGHAHCGQIRLPVIGPLWIPSSVPVQASCGLYEEDGKTIFVSSGIGTSILNFRLGTQSEWDLIEIDIESMK